MRYRPRVWQTAVLLLCLSAAGCGLSDLDLLPRSTRPVVKIGLVAPFEGRDRALGYEVLHAVRWAVRERNAHGGVGGTMVELVALNDNGRPVESAFQARELGVDPAVVGAIGPFSTAAVRAAAPVYQELGLPVVVPATCPTATGDQETPEVGPGQPVVFCLAASADALAEALIERLPAGAQTALLWGEEDPLQAVLAARVPGDRQPGLADLEGAALPPADVYLYSGSALAAAELLREMRGAGVESPLWGGPQLARSQLPQIAGQAAAGTCYAITAAAYASDGFAAGYASLAGHPPGPWAALAFDAAQLLLDAIERDVLSAGNAARDRTAVQLGESGNPEWVFLDGQRREAEIAFYCYGREDSYPGQRMEP